MAGLELVQFEDDGRAFTCRSGPSPATPGVNWWWLEITGEAQRYAAFRVQTGDTAKNLQPRFIAYYAQLLADRARPREVRVAWSKPAPKQDAQQG